MRDLEIVTFMQQPFERVSTRQASPLDAAVTAHGESHLLRLDRAALFELLADHTDLLQGVFSVLLRSSIFARAAATHNGDQPATPALAGSTTSNTVSTP